MDGGSSRTPWCSHGCFGTTDALKAQLCSALRQRRQQSRLPTAATRRHHYLAVGGALHELIQAAMPRDVGGLILVGTIRANRRPEITSVPALALCGCRDAAKKCTGGTGIGKART